MREVLLSGLRVLPHRPLSRSQHSGENELLQGGSQMLPKGGAIPRSPRRAGSHPVRRQTGGRLFTDSARRRLRSTCLGRGRTLSWAAIHARSALFPLRLITSWEGKTSTDRESRFWAQASAATGRPRWPTWSVTGFGERSTGGQGSIAPSR